MKNTIEFTKDLQKRVLGSGQNGTCYLTSDGQVFKRIYKPQIVEGNISSTVGLSNNTYVFPKKLVTIESAIIGYIMDYVDGIELRYLNNEISLRDYINALKIAEYDIAAISSLGIYSFDVKADNMLYTKDNRFKVVDTDLFCKVKKNRELYNINMGNFSHSVMSPIFNMYSSRFKSRHLENKRGDLIEGKIPSSKYIQILLKYMKIRESEDISIKDFSNELKLLYNRPL